MTRIGYNILQALKQIHRNRGMSLASVFAITAMLLILGIFFVVTVNINLFTVMIRADYDQVEVFLDDAVDADGAQDMMDQIERMNGVEKTEYRNKTDAMNILKKRWGENGYLLDGLDKNPLPNSILITVVSVEDAKPVKDQVEKLAGVEDIKYFQDTVEKLTSVTNFIQWGALVIMAFLVVVSVVVVSNTIKLTVFARAREISIMRYIGASNWFIRGPFLVEGVMIGILSSLVSAGLVYLIYDKIVNALGTSVITIFSSPLVPAGYLIGNLVAIFLAIGISIGACGSIISMRKFLDA